MRTPITSREVVILTDIKRKFNLHYSPVIIFYDPYSNPKLYKKDTLCDDWMPLLNILIVATSKRESTIEKNHINEFVEIIHYLIKSNVEQSEIYNGNLCCGKIHKIKFAIE